MSKELFISSSPHETKVAVLEDDLLVEVYHERDLDVGLVGGIYKGRVSRVLPGMQSAFVNIGLERDAFLYVSDFYEDEEEYDKVFSEAEARATRFVEGPAAPVPASAPSEPAAETPANPPVAAENTAAAAPTLPAPVPVNPATTTEPISTQPGATQSPKPAGEVGEYRRHDQRGRRRRRHGRGFGERKFGPRPEAPDRIAERPPAEASHSFEILPGESLAKYRGAAPSVSPEALTEEPAEAGAVDAAQPPSYSESLEFAAEHPAPATGLTEQIPAGAGQSDVPAPAPEAALAEDTSADLVPPFQPRFIAPGEPVAAPPPTEPSAAYEAPHAPELDETHVGVHLPVIFDTHEEGPTAAAAEPPKESAPPEVPETAESVEPVGAAAGEPWPEPQQELAGASIEAADEPATAEAVPGEAPSAEAEAPAEEAATPAEGSAPLEAPEVPPVAGTSGEPTEKKVTVREPYQRPRFSPRRRRGWRGGGSGRGRSQQRSEPSRTGNQSPVQISDLLKEGQEIIVQIAKEPLGTKGARITSHIALPGRYLVYMPTINHIGVSRKINSEDERLRLRNIILENRGSLTGGFIVRTAGGGRSEDEFKADLKFLSTLWNDIKTKAEHIKAPALLHRDLDLVQRILRDTLSPDFKTVRVDNEVEYERCVEFVNRCQPSLVGHVRLYTKNTPLFEEFGIQAEIDKALKPKVWLKSGGYIVINQTEALVAIDVNTGKFVGKTNRLEDTIVKTNIDAVNEIVRQIRLRDLGGIIVIDFIDMDERKNRQKVVQALEEALRRDRAPTKILSFNDFGLVAITRKRVKQSLERTLCQPCIYCSGSGWIKSLTSVCFEILGEVKKMAKELEGDTITLRVNPEVAHALKSRQGALLSEIETLTHKDVIIKSDPLVHQERFEIY
ncbi:MAG: Rne/Rng family ribonuclease [Terriglobia bacterium]